MLKKIHRVTKKRDFDRIFSEGRSAFNRVVGIKMAGNNLLYSRFGIIVSAKISKKAVVRNKIRRRIREIIRSDLDNIKSGYDYIIITLPPATEKDFKETERAVKSSLLKLRAYIDTQIK